MSNFTKLKLCHTLGISQSTHFWVKGALTALLLVLCGNVAKAQTDLTFNEGIRYSKWVIDSRLGDFYGNRKKFGFTTYDSDLNKKTEVSTWYKEDGKTNYPIQVDYVAGLVAKATIEAADYYKKFDWSKPWFKSVEWYGNKCQVSTSPDNLDAINASKMYFGIYNLANGTFKSDAESGTTSKATTQLGNALKALQHYNNTYVFAAGTTLNGKDIAGGWHHKSTYKNQMWLDGQYMGPATLAQLINGYSSYSSNKLTNNDWDLITKQFTIVWEQCWDSKAKLLYHAFSSEQLDYWTSEPDIWDTAQADKTKWTSMSAAGHSAAFWGRAEGWYFLALVDVLEEMQKANLTNSVNYSTLSNYLVQLAAGIKDRQDATTGCWYQLIAKDGSYSASYYRGKTYSAKSNYLESSCTAIFTAAYLKAIRLGFLAKDTYFSVAENAYKGMVKQFMKQRTDGTVDLLGCCKTAGLGTSTDFSNDKFRDGSNAYYLLGADVTPTSTASDDYYTEGKVLGAFILAATEYERQYQNYPLLSEDLRSSYSLSNGKSISVEVTGNSSYTVAYQWYKYDATTSTSTVIDNATEASFKPTASGKYYCEITLTQESSSAITRAANKITYQTRTTDVEVTGTAANLYTVTFNAGSNGTCSTTYIKQASANASINLPSVTANTGYTFDGWYTAAEGGAKVTSPYTPSSDVTLYAHYAATSPGGETHTLIHFTGKKPSDVCVTVSKTDGKAVGYNTSYSVKYNNETYNTSLKIESATVLTLELSEEACVSFVFYDNTPFKLDGVLCTPENGIYTATLSKGTHTITRNSDQPKLFVIDIQPTGPSITISTQPASAEYLTGATTVTPLTVVATLDGYTLSYQWYKNTTNSNTGGTVISGATAKSYTPDVTTVGTTYYYCVVTATKEGSENLTATSNVAAITVSAPYVKFTTQPTSGSYAINNAASALTVVAATNLGVDITYQWYSNSSKATEGSTLIENATSASYTPSTSTVGTKYYYCVASATFNGKKYEAISNIVSIEVVTAIYKYKVSSGDKSPGVNGVKYIEDNAGNTKVKMTFGGWKWGTNTDKNDHSYYVPNKKNELQVDSWSAAETEGVSKLDGYDYWFSGGKDAVDESKAASKDENGKEVPIYGSVRYGWFKTNTTDSEGKVTTYPFTLPVRGAYMTFEPTKNGWLTIYILQNGVWNTYDKATTVDGIEYAKGAIKPGEFRMHSFFITNQRGLTVQDFAPGMYSYDVNQKVQSGYSCSIYERDKKPADAEMNIHGKDVSYWPEFWTLDDDEREAVYTHWKDGDNGSETVIELTNGSFLLIQKAVIKYRFHVTGSETYYFFSNFSKMGFAGAEFQPDNAQPTAELTLTDTEKYTAPTAGTDGKVDNVTIPQYRSITFTRNFKPNQWTTLTLPFNLTQEEVQKIFGDGTRLVMLHDAKLENEGARLTFIYHEIQNVLPGYPYLIKPTLVAVGDTNDANADVNINRENNTITDFTVYNKCINPSIKPFKVNTTPYTFMGTPGYCTPNATDKTGYSVNYKQNDIFVSEGNGNLYVSGGASYGKGYRAWLKKNPGTMGVKSISVVMSSFSDDDDTTTSIDVAEMAPDLIEALGIQTGVYNLSGQRVANDTRNLKAGIYIVNGKKTVVR